MEKQQVNDKRFLKQRIAVMAVAFAVIVGSLWIAGRLPEPSIPTIAMAGRPSLILDPGHGGIDGGAIAYNGVKESDLNLEIAMKLRDMAAFYGCPVVMTREDDLTGMDPSAYSEHENLVQRVDIINRVENGVLISIHQNCYPTSQPFGAQVLYGSDPLSRSFGEMTHGALLSNLQPENRRVAEPASDGLYVTAHSRCPSILVECGFLSNLSDLQLLCSGRYQKAFAAVLLYSYLQFTAGVNG